MSVVARFHTGKGRPPIQALLTLPVVEKDRTIVSDVYPTGDVPENLLKLYLHFSAPMRRTGVYEHIHLTDKHGERIEAPFVEVDPRSGTEKRDVSPSSLNLDGSSEASVNTPI